MEIKIKLRYDSDAVYSFPGPAVHFCDGAAPEFVNVWNDETSIMMDSGKPFYVRHEFGGYFISGKHYPERSQNIVYAHLPQPRIAEPAAVEAA